MAALHLHRRDKSGRGENLDDITPSLFVSGKSCHCTAPLVTIGIAVPHEAKDYFLTSSTSHS
jgi:hypothetical protein